MMISSKAIRMSLVNLIMAVTEDEGAIVKRDRVDVLEKGRYVRKTIRELAACSLRRA